jgi:hypothetical protein
MKTKSFLIGLAVLSVLLAFSVAPVAAVKSVGDFKKPVEDSRKPLLDFNKVPYLVAKNMAAGWVESPDLGIGRFSYPNHGADLQFNAVNLSKVPAEYALISYREPATETDFSTTLHNVLKVGKSDKNGTLKMKIGTGSFLNHLICNSYAVDAPGDYQNITGAKVWLVPTSDLTINRNGTAVFTAWNPDSYLFESDLITQGCHRIRNAHGSEE